MDLLGSQTADELLSRTNEIVESADETLRAMIAQQDGNGLTGNAE